jgi:uncharacterized lipoprotein YajG
VPRSKQRPMTQVLRNGDIIASPSIDAALRQSMASISAKDNRSAKIRSMRP